MFKKSIFIFSLMLFILFPISSSAHDHSSVNVTPEHERKHAAKMGEQGPKKSQGIKSANQLGIVELSEEFPNIGNRIMRAREIVIEPGGIVAVHEHQNRPGLAYILEGEIIEHRNDHNEPLLRKAGDVAFENSGVIHWWENRSSKIVRALVVDIIEHKQ